MRKSIVLAVCVSCLLGAATTQAAGWKLELLKTLDGFDAPESVGVDPENGMAYVSNIAPKTADDGTIRYWEDDGGGFISRIKYEAAPLSTDVEMKWVVDTEQAPLNGPKGVFVYGKHLVVDDNARLLVYRLEDGKCLRKLKVPGASYLNDVALANDTAYLSDTDKGVVHMVPLMGEIEQLPAPKAVNGVTIVDGNLFCVSWDLGDLYDLKDGTADPVAFGLGDHFKTLDSIEVLEDGTFLVTDFQGDKICTVSPDRKTVTTLATMKTPADVGLDRKNGLLFVPSVEGNIVNVYKLSKE